MSRTLFLVLALAATAYAGKLAFNQVDEVLERTWDCLQAVPQNPSSFDTPASYCYNDCRGDLNYGLSKDRVAPTVTRCLSRRGVAKDIVATANQCLVRVLAAPLKPALKEADYSDDEQREIEDRLKSCMTQIPENTAAHCGSTYGSERYPKESLNEYVVTPCLLKSNVAKDVVATIGQCVDASLAQPL